MSCSTCGFEQDGERGGYTVTCRQLPEVAAHGDTFIRAQAAARRAIREALEQGARAGERFPKRREDRARGAEGSAA